MNKLARQAVLNAVTTTPTTVKAVASSLGITIGVAKYHLDYAHKQGELTKELVKEHKKRVSYYRKADKKPGAILDDWLYQNLSTSTQPQRASHQR